MQSYAIQQSTATQPLLFLLVSSSDHNSPLTGASPTVTLSKNGGAFVPPNGLTTEVGSGWYKVAGNATDSNTLGPLVLHATATGADPTDVVFPVVAFNPLSATNLGLSALPTANPAASGGLPTVDASNGVKLSVGTGAGQVNVASGKVPATMGSTDYSGNTVQTGDAFARIGATGSGLTSLAPASTALSTAQWTNARATNLDNLDAAISTRSTYAGADTAGTTTLLARLTAQRATNLDNLDAAVSTRSTFAGGAVASVTGSVGSVVGSVGSVAAPVTVGTVNDKAGYSLDLAGTLAAPRALDSVADASLTLNDALHCAIASAAGKESVTGTAYVVRTPSTGTVLRTFTLDSASAPTSRS
jgi:hypothetical protein